MSVSSRSYGSFRSSLTTSFAPTQVRHDTPFRSSISMTMRSCIGSSSARMIRLGRLYLLTAGMTLFFTGSVEMARGISVWNRLPFPTWLDTEMLPPRRFKSPLVIGRPSPNPSGEMSGAARSNGRNMRSTVSLSMPMPESSTSMVITPSL